jgi:hypothetical protein
MYVHTAMHRPIVTHPDTWRDKKETARRAAFPQPAGRFRRWWQVLCGGRCWSSNQRRLSRRFYRPLSLCTSQSATDQLICPGQMRFSISYASMTSAFGELARPRTGSREATDGPGGSGYVDRPPPIVRRLGVSSAAQASRMHGGGHAAANHFQHVPASTAQSLLPAKGPRGARSRRSGS